MTTTHVTRSDLLSSRLFYDKHRDGPDALPTGTPLTLQNYAGAFTCLTAGDTDPLAMDRAVFFVRAHADELDPALVESIDTMRETRAAGRYDWDCHKCMTAVYTESLDDACPNCLL